jgi:threonine dehydrogenase-like Zn-dependent dehydrogenase
MKAVVFHAVGDIRLDDVPEPTIQEPTDAIVRLTASAICGTDLHFVRGSMSGMKPGTILGHEGVGTIEEVGDDDAITISDIFPTAWFGAKLAQIQSGDTVAVFGCGPVGLFTIASAQLQGAARVLAVDHISSRLQQARRLGAEVIDFSREDPVETLERLTGGTGPERIIDAVGIDAESAGQTRDESFDEEVQEIAPEQPGGSSRFRRPGDAPSQVLRWAVEAVAKAGSIAIIGVYPPAAEHFPIGTMMNKNLTVQAGNCNHRTYVPELIELVRTGAVRPSEIITQVEELTGAIDAYDSFDKRAEGWHKVALDPASV